jgi:RND family efflux transporter MFP subunit
MPNVYTLSFGAPGQVKNIYAQDGDTVKAGQILATLDDKTEKFGLESSSNALQKTLSSLYETVPVTPQVSGNIYTGLTPNPPYLTGNPPTNYPPYILLPGYYPPTPTTPSNFWSVQLTPTPPTYFASTSALEALSWAQDEISNAYAFTNSENYTAAASQLNLASADLDSCARILQDTVDNPQSGLGNTAPFLTENNTWPFLLAHPQDSTASNILDMRRTIGLLRQRQADIQQIQSSISDNDTGTAGPLFQDLYSQLQPTDAAVDSDIGFIKTYYTYPFPYQNLCHYFYGAAQDSIAKTLASSQTGDISSLAFNENLALGRHYMELCNSFLASNEIDLQNGLSQPAEQTFKVNLANNAVAVENANQALLNSIIIAPVDGIIVSVGIKANDVLSNQDYSSVTAFLLVDTSDIEFKGLVDEIDITKVKVGQKVNISVDAVPNKTFTGVVSFISPYGNTVSNVVKYNVTVLLDPTNVGLKGGLSATADIMVSTINNVLLAPISVLNTAADGTTTVTVVDPKTGVSQVRKVTVGSQNLQYAEIKSGLNEGDQVAVTANSNAPILTGLPGGPGGGGGGGGGGPPAR